MTPKQEQQMEQDFDEIKGKTAHILAAELATIAFMELSDNSKGIARLDREYFAVKKKFETKIKERIDA